MSKQDEIREGIAELLRLPDHKTFLILSYLHSQGVVIKVDRELPQNPFDAWHWVTHPHWCVGHDTYIASQDDMKEAGFVAVEPLIKEV